VNDGAVEQPALFQVEDEGGGRFVDVTAGRGQSGRDAGVIVPGLVAGEDRDKTNAPLDETPGDEASGSEVFGLLLIDSVDPQRRFALLTDIEGFLRRDLHAGGEFEALDARLEFGLTGTGVEVSAVKTINKVEVSLLRVALERHGRIEIENARFLRPDHGALVNRGKPSIREVVDPEHGQAAGIGEGDKGGQVLIFGPESVGEPAPEGGTSGEEIGRAHV
jgi:hypothetical protein